MAIIYHITTQSAWDASQNKDSYESPALRDEGFIHCSQEAQIPGVLDRFFKDQTDLVQLTIDTDKLSSQLIFEWSPSIADTFPHIYGPINLDAVIAVKPIGAKEAEGSN